MAKKKDGKILKESLIQFVRENYSEDDEKINYLHCLIDKFVELDIIAQQLRDDISTRGINVEFEDKNGNVTTKKNESIAELNRTTQSMVKLQVQLGIKPQALPAKAKNESEIL